MGTRARWVDDARLAWGLQGHRLVAKVAETRLTAGREAERRLAARWPQRRGCLELGRRLSRRQLSDVVLALRQHPAGCGRRTIAIGIVRGSPPSRRARATIAGATASSTGFRTIWSGWATLSLDRADRAIALKFLVHFVGDCISHSTRWASNAAATAFSSPCSGRQRAAARRRRRRRAICTASGIPRSSPTGNFRMRTTSRSSSRSIAAKQLAARPTGTPRGLGDGIGRALEGRVAATAGHRRREVLSGPDCRRRRTAGAGWPETRRAAQRDA